MKNDIYIDYTTVCKMSICDEAKESFKKIFGSTNMVKLTRDNFRKFINEFKTVKNSYGDRDDARGRLLTAYWDINFIIAIRGYEIYGTYSLHPSSGDTDRLDLKTVESRLYHGVRKMFDNLG